MRTRLFGSLLTALSLTACGAVESDVQNALDGGNNAGACNTLSNDAPTLQKDHHAEPTPTMTGGTIVEGKYFLTAMDKYNGATGTSAHQETWVFSGGNVQVVTKHEEKGDVRFSGTYSTSGNTLTAAFTCPAANAISFKYTATATQIAMVNPDDANEVHTFTKQ